MLFHMSIAAHDPKRVAGHGDPAVVGHRRERKGLAAPELGDDLGDARGTALEVYPADVVLRETDGDADAHGQATGQVAFTATHGAIATALDVEAVMAIAAREGWPAKYRKRGGMFGVVELWIEGRQMMEILTPEMQDEYRASMSFDTWRGLRDAIAAGQTVLV
jgi:hypothetical protein